MTIDERMAALLKDHQEMGARPTEEPAGDTHGATLPLTEKAPKEEPKPEKTTRAKTTRK